jgi:asparaginyl-tRNA synthetase
VSSSPDIHSLKSIIGGSVPLGPITVAGWVRTKRGSKNLSFIHLHDGSCAQTIQVIADAGLPGYESDVATLTTGVSIRVEGMLVQSPGQGQKFEIQATSVERLGAADPNTYPLQKKEMTYEYLREVAHLRPRTALFSSIFRLRSKVSLAIHDFFRERGFFYVHSPILTTSDGEGAGETFTVTSLDLAQVPRTEKGLVDYSQDFFNQKSMLCVTGQLEAELLAFGLGKVYTFGPTFRAENSNTSRHLAEFWMIEPEMAFWNLAQTIDLGCDLIRTLARKVLEESADDLEVIVKRNEVDPRPWLELAVNEEFRRITYSEAVDILLASGQSFEFPVKWGEDLKSEHERYLCEQHFKAPTVVYNYPRSLKAFYMYVNEDGRTVSACDFLVPGIGEVIGGSQREHRLDVLLEQMELKGIQPNHMDWYLDSRRFGTIEHSGFGLGLDRLICWLTGMGNIRDVIPFPRVPGQCSF